MAHQAHGIRWDALVTNLKYHPQLDLSKNTPSDILFRFAPNQTKEIEFFVESFCRNLAKHTLTERAKYPAEYNPPQPDSILIDNRTAKRITPTVYKWRKALEIETGLPVVWSNDLCPHEHDICDELEADSPERREQQDDGFKIDCWCALPYKERRASAFVRQHVHNNCYKFYKANRASLLNVTLMKTLLLYGEMEPVLRACSQPAVGYARWESVGECYDTPTEMGWCSVYQRALDAYVGLNVLYSFPALWDPGSGCRRQRPHDENEANALVKEDEYRNTAAYQRMLYLCTKQVESIVETYPHQEFFGITDTHFDGYMSFRRMAKGLWKWPALVTALRDYSTQPALRADDLPYGQIPIDVFLNSHNTAPYLPNKTAISKVSVMLYRLGLPTELVLDILQLAEYDGSGPRSRLYIAHDPLHPENRDALIKYLTYCWLTLVRCNMLAHALGIEIHWKFEIMRCFSRVFGTPPGKRLFIETYNVDEDRYTCQY
ncbi:hypothetical protein BJY04DRAFT_196704 [Aspergillus karnatakaensis]|uniref:uncharacterized protein n=1 Tax=Aspergillus karnatakaensis TaxID=1810916 RepID=UPI003CCCF37F